MRRLIGFACRGETLLGTLDAAPGATGLLIVSGGNEIRVGAHRGMALLAQRIADAGHPVFRYDRRGVGDSSGENLGFRESAPDLAAAAATFVAEMPQLRRIVAFGNCDAAAALALFHSCCGLDSLVLANPWAVETQDDLPPAAAIRARYAQRLRDPKQWLRLFQGKIDLAKLGKGLSRISNTGSQPASALAEQIAGALAASRIPLTLLLARRDNSAITFRKAWESPIFDAARGRATLIERDSASHSFATAADKDWLFAQLKTALEG